MGVYVRMTKTAETGVSATYSYSTDMRRFGEACLDKRSGDVRMVRRAEGDTNDHLYVRAAAKLRREWQSGRMPQVTEWAS